MPVPAYLSVTGEHQGLITAGNFTEASVGNIYQEGHEDECLVEAFAHTIMLPRDPQSGQPSGQRVHKALKITKVTFIFISSSLGMAIKMSTNTVSDRNTTRILTTEMVYPLASAAKSVRSIIEFVIFLYFTKVCYYVFSADSPLFSCAGFQRHG